jgi:LPS sulfotransferase NodH
MSENAEIEVDTVDIAKIAAAIPNEDFVDAQYDCDWGTATTDLLLVLSTQRSGSTLLADLMRKSKLCLPHEYFQPYYYLPLLADRWGCIENGLLDKQAYLDNLFSLRTYPNGWLGINLHGVHLETFAKFGDFGRDLNVHYVHLQRQDLISQAVSYEIASQTGKWSSFFEGSGEAKYNFKSIRKRLRFIEEQDAAIRVYLAECGKPYHTVYYEDLVSEPEVTVKAIAGAGIEIPALQSDAMKKQAGKTNQDWIERFARKYSRGQARGK